MLGACPACGGRLSATLGCLATLACVLATVAAREPVDRAYLAAWLDRVPDEVLRVALGLTPLAFARAALESGLRGERLLEGRRWTPGQDEVLRREYPGCRDVGELARRLQRTPQATQRRAAFLGVTRFRKWQKSADLERRYRLLLQGGEPPSDNEQRKDETNANDVPDDDPPGRQLVQRGRLPRPAPGGGNGLP